MSQVFPDCASMENKSGSCSCASVLRYEGYASFSEAMPSGPASGPGAPASLFYRRIEGTMSFLDNLQKKVEIDKLANRVSASCGSSQVRRPVDKAAMRGLLALSTYRHQQERDLDLYVKPVEGELNMVLVLDNELPIFRSTVKDVVVRRSPRTLELWSIRTIRRILIDSDIKESVYSQSVETIRQDALAQLDLRYTDGDIISLARDGMAWLAGGKAGEIEKTLALFAALLGLGAPPRYFGLDTVVCFGRRSDGKKKGDDLFGPMVLYRPDADKLLWIDRQLSRSNLTDMEFLRAIVAGQASASLTGDAVFAKLQELVLARPERVVPL